MELLQLRYFKDAAEIENFSKVAEKNMVPQPSISKTIKKLEDELGCNLFDRNGKKISLNDNGKYFYQHIFPALANIDEAVSHFIAPSDLNICLYVQAGSRYVSMLTADFLMSTKDIFVSTITRLSEKNHNQYDFTFMQLQEDISRFNYEKLMDEDIALVVSKNHKLCNHKEISIKELKDYDFVGYYSTMNLRELTDKYCTDIGGFTPNVIFETADNQALRYMISKNKGIALIPNNVHSAYPSDKFAIISLKEKVCRTLIIAWDKNRILSKQSKDFLKYTKNWFRNF